MKKVVVILGPTAVGKTALSLQLAETYCGEIISADSRLFYRGMNIGTAKPTAAETAQIPHHLIDICDPDETITLGEYQRLAYQTIDSISNHGRLPIIAGGTGQYIMAVVEGWGIPEVPPQPAFRKALESLGEQELNRWLAVLDPLAEERIDRRNVRRVIRALEVTLVSGRPITELQRKTPPPYDFLIIGLHRTREQIFERIDRRVDMMIEHGLLNEVQALRTAGYGPTHSSMSGLGYRQLFTYLDGQMSFEEAVERIKFETHRFARQQNTWFRKDDPRIHWFNLDEEYTEDQINESVRRWLQN